MCLCLRLSMPYDVCAYVPMSEIAFCRSFLFRYFQNTSRILNCNEPAHWKSIDSIWRNHTHTYTLGFPLLDFLSLSLSFDERKWSAPQNLKCNASRLWLDKPAIWIIFFCVLSFTFSLRWAGVRDVCRLMELLWLSISFDYSLGLCDVCVIPKYNW